MFLLVAPELLEQRSSRRVWLDKWICWKGANSIFELALKCLLVNWQSRSEDGLGKPFLEQGRVQCRKKQRCHMVVLVWLHLQQLCLLGSGYNLSCCVLCDNFVLFGSLTSGLVGKQEGLAVISVNFIRKFLVHDGDIEKMPGNTIVACKWWLLYFIYTEVKSTICSCHSHTSSKSLCTCFKSATLLARVLWPEPLAFPPVLHRGARYRICFISVSAPYYYSLVVPSPKKNLVVIKLRHRKASKHFSFILFILWETVKLR